jgi:hypothetical protein
MTYKPLMTPKGEEDYITYRIRMQRGDERATSLFHSESKEEEDMGYMNEQP